MLEISAILVPVDFSERSTAAAQYAVALAERFRSKLIFTHIVPRVPAEMAAFEGAVYTAGLDASDEASVKSLAGELDCFARKVGGDGTAEKVVRRGDPATEIARIAHESAVDLVVMATHGYGPFRRFVLGSVTAKVLHDVDCPVFTGAHVTDMALVEPRPYHRIACALDLSDHSEKVLRWAAQFAAAYHAGLAVIHAAPPLDITGGGHYLGPEWRTAMVQSAQGRAEGLIQRVGCRAEVYIDSAEATRYVPFVVTDTGADLLVVGRSAPGGVLGRLRTNAYALIRESPRPVISV